MIYLPVSNLNNGQDISDFFWNIQSTNSGASTYTSVHEDDLNQFWILIPLNQDKNLKNIKSFSDELYEQTFYPLVPSNNMTLEDYESFKSTLHSLENQTKCLISILPQPWKSKQKESINL